MFMFQYSMIQFEHILKNTVQSNLFNIIILFTLKVLGCFLTVYIYITCKWSKGLPSEIHVFECTYTFKYFTESMIFSTSNIFYHKFNDFDKRLGKKVTWRHLKKICKINLTSLWLNPTIELLITT